MGAELCSLRQYETDDGMTTTLFVISCTSCGLKIQNIIFRTKPPTSFRVVVKIVMQMHSSIGA